MIQCIDNIEVWKNAEKMGFELKKKKKKGILKYKSVLVDNSKGW